MLYAWSEDETEESLKQDPDVNLVPTLLEKIILPKLKVPASRAQPDGGPNPRSVNKLCHTTMPGILQ
ncbi:hypothetical protein EVAR_91353_1 [Eumeta japonica]|uniref:Uncharacterized protein n=1 Tax=Eumeta variegata TaxID=151549 RepID=A0A4C1TCJ4_EUMVA|nr:hypothetical protein EVAR_91353_1 [Eumeta japonica]